MPSNQIEIIQNHLSLNFGDASLRSAINRSAESSVAKSSSDYYVKITVFSAGMGFSLNFRLMYQPIFFSAGWEKDVHEIWGAFIDRQEAVKRIVERDGKTEEQAEARLSNQMSNHELISKCNNIFYTKWDYSITHQQVAKAWSRLNQIL